MLIPIYVRKYGTETVKIYCIGKLVLETTSHVKFLAPKCLSVDLDSHYYLKRKEQEGTLELWLIEFATATEMKPAYTYIASWIEKYRDVADGWVEDSDQNA